jgi:hypothetical protein
MPVDKLSVSSLPLATLQTPNVLGSVRTLAGREVRAKGWGTAAAPMHSFCAQRRVGVATEKLLTKKEQVSDGRACATG